MKQNFWKRFLALVMAIAIVLSTGVLDSASMLLASGGEETSQETTTEPTNPPSDQQGGTSTETLDLSTDPTGESTAPSEGAAEDETTESTPAAEVTLTVVISAVFADESREGYVLGTEYLTYAEGEESKTIETDIPAVEGYSFAITGAAMTKNAEGKHVATLARPAESEMLYITVTYSPVVIEEEATEPTEDEATEPTEDEATQPTEGETTQPTEGEGAAALTTTVVVVSADMGGVLTFDDAVYTFTWAEDETEKVVSVPVASIDGYAYVVDSEDFTGDGAGNFSGTIARPEESNVISVEVFYRASESVQPDEIYTPNQVTVDTYIFVLDGETVSTQKVQSGETVYAPASPTKDGYKFMGWLDASGNAFAQAETVTGATYTYTASFEPGYYLFFADEQGRVKETHLLLNGDKFDTTNHKIVLDNKNLAITGWSATPVNPNEAGTAVGEVTINSANILLYPITVTAFSITFDTQGGSLMDSAFYYGNQPTVAPAENATTRSGYMFRGWYLEPECNTSFGFGNVLTQSITLYAKWEASQNTQYTVIHWWENANDDYYSFHESEVKIGMTGGQTNATVKSYSGFTVVTEGDKAWSQETIAGDGSTIINIYYDRIEYTIYFYKSDGTAWYNTTCGKTEHTHSWRNGCYEMECSGRHSGMFSHSESASCYNTDTEICGLGVHTHSNSCYSSTAYTITAKHGAQIGHLWPLNNGSSRWAEEKGGSSYQNNIDVMPIGDEDYYAPSDSDASLREVEYYVSILPGETAEVTKGGVGYKIHHVDRSYGSTSSVVGDEDRYPITGYTLNTTHSTAEGKNYANAQFFYDRNSYQIIFMQGGTEDSRVTKLYEQSLEGVDYTPEMPADMPKGSTFVGWFDNQFLEGDPYVFEGTMPAQNITLYAKWQEPTHEAEIHFDIILENGSIEIHVPYGELLEDHLPEGYTSVSQIVQLSDGLTWDGQWLEIMSDGSFKAFFDINAPITRPVRIAPNITSKESYSVTYKVNGGTGSVTDSKAYYYGAYADVAYPTGVTAPEGKVFLGWTDGTHTWQPGDSFQVSKDVTLTAVWGDAPTTTSITYNANGGVGGTKTYDDLISNSTQVVKNITANGGELAFSRPGYKFLGWSRNASATSATYLPGNNIIVGKDASTNVLYAVWEQVEFSVTYSYTGTVPAGAPAAPAATTKAYSETVTVEAAPSLEGYTFSGWNTSDATVSGGTFTMPEKDVAFTGSWTVNQYTVTYKVDGVQVGEVETYDYNQLVTIRDKYVKEGYTVSDWSVTADFNMPAEDVVIEATTTINSYDYTVQYQDEAGNSLHADKTAAADFGTTITAASEVIDIDGYTYKSGNDITITTGENVMTLVYTQRTDLGYIVKYVWGETELISATKEVTGQTFGTTVTEEAIAIDGYTLNDDASKSITITTGENVIVFHYNKDVTFTGETAEKVYNGSEQTITGIDVSGLKDGHRYEAMTYAATGTNVGTYQGEFFGDVVIKDADGNDVTKYYNVTKTPGTLTITKASFELTITGNSGTKTYNGTEQEVTGFTSTGLLEGHEIIGLTHTAKGTNVGEHTGEFTGTVKVMDGETDVTQNYVITKNPGTLTITASGEWTLTAEGYTDIYDGKSHAASASASVTEGTTISYKVGEGEWTTTAPSITDVGEMTVQVKAENPNYNTLETTVTLKVTPAEITVITGSGEKTYDGEALTSSKFEVEGLVEGETVTVVTTGSQTEVGESSNTYTLTWDTAKQSNYTVKDQLGTLKVNERAVTVTITGNKETKTFSGEEQKVEGYTVAIEDKSGLYTEAYIGFTGEAVAKGTDVDTYPMGLTESQFTNTNKNFTVTFVVVDGQLEITPKAVTVTADDKTKVYGEADPELTATVVGLVDGDTVSYTLSRKTGEDVGEYTITPAGEATQGNYTVTYVTGTLEITKRPVTIKSESASKDFDGVALMNENAAVVAGSFADGEGVESYHDFASITYPGSIQNTFQFTLQNNTKESNYDITVINGQLTVTDRETKYVINITANSDTVTYTGKEQTVTGFTTELTFTFNGVEYTVTGITAEGKGTNAGDYTVVISGDAKVMDPSNVDVTGQFTVNLTNGTLVINKAPLTIVTPNADKVYDGTALTAAGKISGFVNDETATFETTGTQTEVGSSKNTYSLIWDGTADKGNYEISETIGTLLVTESESVIVVTTTGGTFTYDGTAHGATVSVSELPAGYSLEAAASSATATNVADGTVAATADILVIRNAQGEDVTSKLKISYVDGTITIIPRNVTLTSATDSKQYDGQPLTNDTVTVTGDGFVTGEDATYDVTGSQTEQGSSANTFTYTLNEGTKADNYNITKVEGTLTVTPVTEKVTVTITEHSGSEKYDGTEKTVTGYEVDIDNTLYKVTDFTFSGDATVKGTDAGTYNMELTAEMFKNISTNFSDVEFKIVDGTLDIAKRNVTLTSATDSKVYDGEPLTNDEITVSGDDFAPGEGAAYDVTGTITNAGSVDNAFTYTLNEGTLADNYNISTEFGVLTVSSVAEKVTVTITENSGSELYDGSEKTVTGYEVDIDNTLYKVTDFTFSGDATVKGTDAGTYNMELTADMFKNISTNFSDVEFKIVDGTLDIAKRNVTLTSATDSKVYDGTALTNEKVTVSGDGFADGEGATYDVTGSQTAEGSSKNTFTYALNANTKAGNYEITTVEGTLTVTALTNEIVVTITEHSGNAKYDGVEHTVSGYDVAISNGLYTENDFTFSGDATVSGTNAGSYNMELKAEDFTNTSDNFTNVRFVIVDGTLDIAKRNVTLTSASHAKVYDGTPLTNSEVTVGGDGFVTGEGATCDVTGTITDVGSTENTFSYTLNEGTLAGNYNIETEEGTLTVTPVTGKVTVTITEHSGSYTYDGTEKTVTGYDVAISNELYKVTDFTFSGDATVKGTDASTYEMELTADMFKNISANFSDVEFVIVDGQLVIDKAEVTVTITGNTASLVYNGAEQSVTGYETEISDPLYLESYFSFSGEAKASGTDVGTYPMGLAVDQFTNNNDNFTVTFVVVDGQLEITPVTEKVTVTITGRNDTVDYDGTEHSVSGYDVDISNKLYTVSDFTFSGTAEAARTEAGTTEMGLAEDQFANISKNFTNVTFVVTDGFQTVKPIDVVVTIVGNNNTTVYDGKEHVVTGYEATTENKLYDVTKDFTFSGKAEAKRTEEGTTYMGLKAEQFQNTNPNFATVTFNVTDGYQTITPIDEVVVTITGHTSTVDYDGTEHTVSGYDVKIDNPLYTEADFEFTGEATASRTDAGTTNMGLTAEQFANTNGNFAKVTFVVTDGYQKVNPINVTVTITGHNNTTVYDGAEHVVTGYDVEISNDLYTEDDFTFTGTAEAARTDVGTANMNLAASQFANTNPNFATVTFNVTDGYQTVTKMALTITADSASKAYDGTALTKDSYTSTGLAEGDEFQSVTVTGSITEVGSTANVPSDAKILDENDEDVTGNYDITYVNGTLEITKSTKTLTVTANSNSWTYDSEYHADGGYTVTYGDETYTVAAGQSATLSTGDTVTATITKQVKNVADSGVNEIVTLVVENEAQYANIKTENGTLTITPRPITITADSASKEYDGTALTKDSYTNSDPAKGDEITSVTVTGSITAVGTTDNVPSEAVIMDGTEDVTANYEITYTNGTLEITQSTKELKVVANSNTWTYDSEYHADGGYTVTYGDETYTVAAGESATLSTGDKVTATITAQVKNVADTAEGNNEIVALVIENAEQYANVETKAGKLEITPREITITADSDAKEYDGTALENDGYTYSEPATGDKVASVTVTGSITEIGKVDNVPSEAVIMDGTEDVTANYDIEYVNGELEITASSKSLVVTANSNTWTYDSEYHADGGYTVTYNGETYTVAAGESATLSTGDKVTATITAQVKNVADTAEGNNVIVELVVENAEQYASIVKVNGTLEITPREITITADSASKEYDGTALTQDSYTNSDPATNDEITSVTVTGSITKVGTTANVPSAAVIMDGEEDVTANYDIEYVNGELKITESSKVLKVVANSNTWTYDGEYHADGGYTVTYGEEVYTVKAGESATLSTGDKVTATITKQVKNVADSGVNEIVTLVVENEAQYATIETENGTLEITQKAVTITADSASREYNGTALTKDSYTSTDLAEGDNYASVTVTGTITEVGSVDNIPSDAIIMDGEEDVTANYAITYINGKLTINAMSDEVVVTIRENSGSAMYDGKLHTVNGYEVIDISDELYTVNDFTFSGDATVNGTDAGTYEMELESGDFTNISDNFAKVTFVIEDGELEISKRTVTMTSADATKAYDGLPLTDDTVTVTGDGFVSGEGAAYDVTGSQTEYGSSANTFTYTLWQNTKADNYIITTVEGTLEVTASEEKVTVVIRENSGSFLYDGTEHTVSGYVVTSISDPLYTVADFTFSGDATVKGTDAGTYEMELKSTDFANISDNFANVAFIILDGQLEITKRNVTMTSATDTKVYDGTALTNDTVTVTDDGFAAGEGASYDVTGSQTEFGSSANTFTYTLNEGTKADNYIIKTVEGTLTVTALTDKVTVVITENSGEYTYDGQSHEVTGYVVTSISNPLYTVADFSFNGDASVKGTDAGVYDMQLKPTNFANTSKNFANVEFVIVDGQLTINKRALTLTSDSDSKEYDGIALTAENVEVTEGSFVQGEGYAVDITGTQTLVGESDNTFTYSLNQGTKAGNYEITVVYGKLTVTDRENPYQVVVEANSGEQVYNGQPFTVSGLKAASVARMAARIDEQTITFVLNGNTFTITGLYASRTETNVNPASPAAVDVLPYSGYEVPVSGTAVITDAQGNDVSAQFDVETISGLLTIHPAPVTMVSADDTKLYDGTELINHEITVTGFVDGEGATYDVTGTQTLIGSSENEFTYALNEGTLAQNYSIETTFGTLTVTPPEAYEIVDKTHEAGNLYRLGDTVTFDITVENIFSEEAKVTVTEQEGVSILWNGQKVQSLETTIPAGETLTLQAEYIIQEKDILAGDFTNVVDVHIAATVDEIPYEGDDDDDDTVDEIEDPKAHLTLDKITTSTPANGSKYVVGETITYQITATNTGNLTLHDVVIYDVLTGEIRDQYALETETIETTFKLDVILAPGESYSFTYEHTVVEEDLGKDMVNAVTGEAGNSSDEDDEEENDTPTEVDPDETEDPTDDIRRGLDAEKTVLNKKDIYKLHTYVEYQIVVTNLGNVTERGVILTDIMDAQGTAKQFTFTDLDGGQLLPGNQVLLADLAPGESVTILCKYWVDGKDEDLPVNNKVIVESDDGDVTDEDDAETVQVEKLYNLTIYYLSDDWQVVMAPEYHGRYSVGHTYYVESPVIEGYVANYPTIWSGYEGMPEHDVVLYVLYTKLPEETTEPTTEPTDPSEETTEPTTEPTEPTYDLTEIPEDEVPLGDVDLGNHTCCILHFLIMLVAMILLGFYTKDRKKYQERIHELKRALAAEDAAAAVTGEEQA